MNPDSSTLELLAPAGNFSGAVAAFDSGADAVYAGLAKFNARIRTENFSPEEMYKLVVYAHRLGKKVYITLNTLVKENEIPEMATLLQDINDIHPDAVIVQDIGVIHLIREFYPSLVIHASTQMGIHNHAGTRIASEMGIQRIILERQVTDEELKSIIKKSPVEIEVFIHGALCCSLSGNCLFSSWMGGWSGNRGICKQPCRRRFISREGNGFFFSTRDFYSLERIPMLKESGVVSLKIEGRLRRADYVKNVVTAYRMMLDATPGEENKILPQAKNVLSRGFGRKWSDGFTNTASFKTVIQHETPGVSGLLCGKVIRTAQNGFVVSLSQKLQLNDRIRIQPQSNDEGVMITVTKMTSGRRNVSSAKKGERCFIHCDKQVSNGATVYIIGTDEIFKQPEINVRFNRARASLDLLIQIGTDGFNITVDNIEEKPQWNYTVDLQKAEKHSLTDDSVSREFSRTASDYLAAGNISVIIADDFFVPLSTMKKIRRQFWQWAEKTISPDSLEKTAQVNCRHFLNQYKSWQGISIDNSINTVALKDKIKPPLKHCTVARSIFDMFTHKNEVILPPFCAEQKLPDLTRMVADAYEKGVRAFRVTSLYQFALLKKFEDINITVSFPLPVCNSLAIRELALWHCEKIQAWVELEKKALTDLIAKSSLPIEIYRYGRIPILATRAKIPVKGRIQEFYGKSFSLHKEKFSHLTYLFPEEVITIPELNNTSNFYDLARANWKQKNTSDFNFNHQLT